MERTPYKDSTNLFSAQGKSAQMHKGTAASFLSIAQRRSCFSLQKRVKTHCCKKIALSLSCVTSCIKAKSGAVASTHILLDFCRQFENTYYFTIEIHFTLLYFAPQILPCSQDANTMTPALVNKNVGLVIFPQYLIISVIKLAQNHLAASLLNSLGVKVHI